MFSKGPISAPFPMEFRSLFPDFEKNPNLPKKKKKILLAFEDWDFHNKLHGDNLLLCLHLISPSFF